jgi:predicted metal-dependent hydrolase
MGIIVRRKQAIERPATIRQTLDESIDGIPYQIRTFRNAKRMSLKVSHDGRVWVSLPPRIAVRDARKFVQQNIEYVRAALDRAAARSVARQQERIHAPLKLPVQGEWYDVELTESDRYECLTSTTERRITIRVPSNAIQHQRESLYALALRYWRYTAISRANAELPVRTIDLARSVGETLRRISIRSQRTLWGSCSATRRSISLNWRSVLFPDQVRDYLILHEIAHLRHPNHSRAYWEWVGIICPWYSEAEAWISEHGRTIMAITDDISTVEKNRTHTNENIKHEPRSAKANAEEHPKQQRELQSGHQHTLY